MPFTQTYHGPIHEVYNVDGTLMLNRSSGPPDLAQSLTRVKADLAALPDLPPKDRQKIEASIDSALTEAKSGKPDGETIKARLDGAAEAVRSAAGFAESGQKLAETIIAIGKWAALFLA
jgi:hypothetical protein